MCKNDSIVLVRWFRVYLISITSLITITLGHKAEHGLKVYFKRAFNKLGYECLEQNL